METNTGVSNVGINDSGNYLLGGDDGSTGSGTDGSVVSDQPAGDTSREAGTESAWDIAQKAIQDAKSRSESAAGGAVEETVEDTTPESVEDSTEAPESTETKSLSWDDTVKALGDKDPHLASLAKNLRADYTRKTQEIASLRKELSAQRDALMSSLREVREAMTGVSEDAEFDFTDPKSIKAMIAQEWAARQEKLLKPLEQMQQEQEANQSYESFVSEHPDLQSDSEVRAKVFQTLQANESMDLSTAYKLAKYEILTARQTMQQVAAEKAKKTAAAQKKAVKSAAMATGSGRSAGAKSISTGGNAKKMNAWEIYQSVLKNS